MWIAGFVVALAAAGCTYRGDSIATPKAAMTIRLSSPAFTDLGAVPRQYTCDGADLSPPLDWADLPSDTGELALLVEDPDAPGGTFVHWVLWAVSPTTKALPEGSVPPSARQGRNSFGSSDYRGPCPPKGKGAHRYVFTLFALSEALNLPAGASADTLKRAMAGKVLAEGRITAHYGR